jgi:hypothetical protein
MSVRQLSLPADPRGKIVEVPGMCTLYANSAREALVKMCTLPLLAGENVSAALSAALVTPHVLCSPRSVVPASGSFSVRTCRVQRCPLSPPCGR